MESENEIGLSNYFAAFRRRRGTALAFAVPLFLVALIVAIALPSIYRSSAVFRLQTGANPEGQKDDDAYADQYVSNLTNSVLSPANIDALVKQYDLYPSVKGDYGAVTRRLVKDIHVDMITEKILDPGSGRERIINTGFSVSYDNRAPDVAYGVTSFLTKAFQTVSREDAKERIANEAKLYDEEADRTRSHIAELETKLADFKKNNFDQLPEAAQANLNTRNQMDQEIDSVEREVRTLQQSRNFVLQQLQQAQSDSASAESVRELEDEYKKKQSIYADNHPDMISLRRQIELARKGGREGTSLQAQLNTQRAILAETRQRYSEDHPDVRRLMRNIESLEKRIAAGEKADVSAENSSPLVVQLRTQMNGLDNQIASLQARGQDMRNKRIQLQTHLASTPQVERDYQALTRDLGTARQQYDQLINHRMDAEVRQAAIVTGTADKFTLIDAPGKPRAPSKPARLAIALMGFIGAVAFALMGTVAAEAFDASVRGTHDLRNLLRVSPLSIIPEVQNSISRRQRSVRLFVWAASIVVGLPIVYTAVKLLVT